MSLAPQTPWIKSSTAFSRTASQASHGKKKSQLPYRVAVMIPMCGAAGMWAPSCIASAEAAVKELNAQSGIDHRPVEMIVVDAAIEAERPCAIVIDDLIQTQMIDAIVGMHISAVRQMIARVLRGRIPFVYTPLYEGGEASPGVFTIGDTPARQLGPAIRYMSHRFKLKKWALIGNDYIWPRASHAYAKRYLQHHHHELVFERYLPFSSPEMARAVEALGKSGADGVLISLIGQDAVEFNRIFGAMDLHRKMFRLSCIVEENGLLASGAHNLDRLFSSASYFAALNTEENAQFRETYHNLHQHRAPMLNALGQSTYEGFHFLASMVAHRGEPWGLPGAATSPPIRYKSARHGVYRSNAGNGSSVYLARANGFVFDDFQHLS
ncbi:MAG: substrate-binding domain-containing protein [Paracoccaceae bacterium]|nr:substrate-binding domain-containing protein [Paracoccaceae bacterium]